ncbi:hypothetical protein ACFLUS_02930 [Chloroflexota bacterium]
MNTNEESPQEAAEVKKPFGSRLTFKPKESGGRTLARHRTTISLLILSILAGLALKSGAISVYEIIEANELDLFKWQLWVPTLIFLITLFRFLLGNFIHIRTLEDEAVGPFTWLYDLTVIALELLLFNIIGNYLMQDRIIIFSNLLRILLGIDICWVISIAIGYAVGKSQRNRKSVPWQWGLLNLVSISLLSFQIVTPSHLNVTQEFGLLVLGIVMFVTAVIDITLVDVYGLLRTENELKLVVH